MNTNIKNIKFFTLIELLVSMGIFSILLVLSMNFFTSAQKMWVSAEEKSELYSDSRIIMDIISSRLQTIYYSTDTSSNVPMEIQKDKIIFSFQSKDKFSEKNVSNLKYAFLGVHENKFHYYVLSDAKYSSDGNSEYDPDFILNFPPFGKKNGNSKYENAEKALSGIRNDFQSKGKKLLVVKNVTGLKFTCYNKNMEDLGDKIKYPPYLIEIELKLMSKTAFKHWEMLNKVNTESANNYKKQYEQTFRRAVFLSDKWNNNL